MASGGKSNRRRFIGLALAGPLAKAQPSFAQVPAQSRWQPQVGVDARIGMTPEGVLESLLGGAMMRRGRVSLEVPAIAESGHSVPLTIRVSSPMTDTDYVSRIDLVSEKNPVAHLATFFLGAYAGRAEVSSHIRLNGSQRLTVVAQISDGSFWFDAADIAVTEAACLDGG